MYREALENMAALSVAKSSYLKKSRLSYLVASILAGVYVGFGIILIFTVGAPLADANAPVVNLVMGLSFWHRPDLSGLCRIRTFYRE